MSTTPLAEPTLAEVIRRLDGLSETIRDLVAKLDVTYVRRDVHEVVHRTIEQALADKADRDVVLAIRAELDEQHDFRRKILFAAIGLGLSNVAALAVAVVQHLSGT